MVGIVTQPVLIDEDVRVRRFDRVRDFVHEYRYFLLLVVLPTLIVAAYLYLVASDQYESSADYVVKNAEKSAAPSGMGQMLGMSFGAGAVDSDAHLVSDYLLSNNAVARLRKENQLVEKFRRPSIDFFSRLWESDPEPEQLLDYYESKVRILNDPETGISHLSVRAFTPDDAEEIASKLLLLGEERINALNERTYRDSVEHSARELRRAESDLSSAEVQLTSFRRGAEDIDPAGTGRAQTELVTRLTGDLSAARARLQSIQSTIGTDSPQYRAMRAQVTALEGQLAGQSGVIATNDGSIASRLGKFENLIIRRETAAKSFAAATAAFETAKAEASRKQVYLVRVVDVNHPGESEFPKREKTLLLVFVGLALAYGIGRMIVTGIREHHI